MFSEARAYLGYRGYGDGATYSSKSAVPGSYLRLYLGPAPTSDPPVPSRSRWRHWDRKGEYLRLILLELILLILLIICQGVVYLANRKFMRRKTKS
jgi:hypothetical protein